MTARRVRVGWTSVVSALVVCQLLGAAAPAAAQGAWSGVLTDLSGYQAEGVDPPAVVVDQAGNAIAVWSRRNVPTVQAARFTAASGTWSPPIGLVTDGPRTEHATIAMDGGGNAVVVWSELGGYGRIRALRYLAATGTFTAPVDISDAATGYAYDGKPHLAVDPAGNALVIWRATIYRDGFREYVTQGVRFTAASASWGPPVALSAIMRFDTQDDEDATVALDRFGNGLAVWKLTTGLQSARYVASSGWGPTVDLTAPGEAGFRPRIAFDQAGTATAVWTDLLQGIGSILTARHSPSSGWSDPIELSDAAPTSRPDLAIDSAGNVTAIWEEGGLRARRYAAASGVWQDAVPVGTPVADAIQLRGPELTVDGQGIVTAVWSNRSLIESARFTPATNAWSSPVTLSRINALNYRASFAPQLAADPAGNVVVVWSQAHGGDFNRVNQSTRWQVSGAVNNTVPSGLTAGIINTQVTLRWVAPLAAVPTYVVEAGSSPGAADLARLEISGSEPSARVIAPPGLYYVRVRSRIGGSLSLPSNEMRLQVGTPCTAPTAPSNLTNSTTSSSVSLSWLAGTGATSYVLEAGSSPGASNVAVLNTGSTATTFSTAAPPGLYYVRIRSRNACGLSDPSNETTVTVGCSAPSAPGTMAATVNGRNVALSWGAASGATSYIVEAGSTPGASNLGQFPATSLGLATSAPPGIYYVRVRARSACGLGPVSNEIVVTVQ